MTLPESMTKVTPLSKFLALTLFVLLPFIGAYIGYRFGKSTVIPATCITETKPTASSPTPLIVNVSPNPASNNVISLPGFNLSIPATWKLDKIDSTKGAIITTQNLPYHVTLMLKIIQVKPSENLKGNLMGVTADGASIHEEVGIGGTRFVPYIVTYPSGDIYNYQWDMDSNQTNPEAEGIWTPDHNFSQDDLLTIVKSSSKNKQ